MNGQKRKNSERAWERAYFFDQSMNDLLLLPCVCVCVCVCVCARAYRPTATRHGVVDSLFSLIRSDSDSCIFQFLIRLIGSVLMHDSSSCVCLHFFRWVHRVAPLQCHHCRTNRQCSIKRPARKDRRIPQVPRPRRRSTDLLQPLLSLDHSIQATFEWGDYLTSTKSHAAPVSSFLHVRTNLGFVWWTRNIIFRRRCIKCGRKWLQEWNWRWWITIVYRIFLEIKNESIGLQQLFKLKDT